MPCSTAHSTAWVRLVTPIARYAVRMWDFTVFIDSSRRREISLLGAPGGDQGDDVRLARRQPDLDDGATVVAGAWLVHGDQSLAEVHLLQRRDQLLGRQRLGEVAVRAGAHRPLDEAGPGLPGVDRRPVTRPAGGRPGPSRRHRCAG